MGSAIVDIPLHTLIAQRESSYGCLQKLRELLRNSPLKHKAPTSDLAVPSKCPTLCTVGHLYYTPPTPSPTKCPQPGTVWDSPTPYSPGFQLAKATRHTQSTQGMATPSRLGEEVFHLTHSNKHRE